MNGFILLDAIVALEPGIRCVAQKCFQPDDSVFLDHFPGYPVVPGALLTETMAQTGGWTLRAALDDRTVTVLAMVQRATFRHPVRPGETLRVEARVTDRSPTVARLDAEVVSRDRLVASAQLAFAIGVRTGSEDDLAAYAAWRRRVWAQLGAERALRAGGVQP
jgi:3-hydroxyacyl-[acyl-carrier-protein] dehydratase